MKHHARKRSVLSVKCDALRASNAVVAKGSAVPGMLVGQDPRTLGMWLRRMAEVPGMLFWALPNLSGWRLIEALVEALLSAARWAAATAAVVTVLRAMGVALPS